MDVDHADSHQAARCLKRATELLKHESTGKAIREVLWLATRQLSPGDFFAGDASAEITVLGHIATKTPVAEARSEIRKAVAMLRGERKGFALCLNCAR